MSITLQNHTVQRVWSKSKSNLKYALSYLLCEWALCYTCTPIMKPRKNFAIKLQKLPCHNNIMKDRKVLSYGRTFSTAWLIVIGKHCFTAEFYRCLSSLCTVFAMAEEIDKTMQKLRQLVSARKIYWNPVEEQGFVVFLMDSAVASC